MDGMKKPYIKPELTEWGTIANITAGGPNGSVADSNFSGFNNRGGMGGDDES